MVLNTAKSSGDHQLDLKVLEETILELEKGCAAGPIPFISLEKGAVISRRSSDLVCKTYDLKSAYRQVPIRCGHLRYGFFLIFNAERQSAEIHQLRTLPFGETHSVYSFQGPFSLLPPTSMMISS